MKTATSAPTAETISRAYAERDAQTLASLYAEDAELRLINADHPSSAPQRLVGRPQIAAYYDDVCARDMSHQVDRALFQGDAVAFNLLCSYPDGQKVYCATMLELRNGKIIHQTTVQAWDI